jgi:hypothetical protein
MSKAIVLAAALVAAPALAAASQEDGAARVYAATMVHAPYTAAARVGARRAGLMCLPQGAVYWRDLSARDDRWSIQLIDDALAADGLAVDRSTRMAASRVEIRGEIRRIGFSLCARRWGPGDASALDGDGALQMEWRVDEGSGAPRVHVSSVRHHLDRGQAASPADLYEMLLTDAATDLAHWLKAGAPPEAVAAPATADR